MGWNKDTPCWSSTPKHQEPVLLAQWTRRNRRLSPKVHPWMFSSCLQALWRLEPLIIKRETVEKCFAKSQRESREESKVSKVSSYVFSRVSFQRNQGSFEGLAYTVCIYSTCYIWYMICNMCCAGAEAKLGSLGPSNVKVQAMSKHFHLSELWKWQNHKNQMGKV